MHYAERELFRYTKGSVREHNLLKNQLVHTKFLLNRYFPHPSIELQGTRTGVPKGLANIKYVNLATLSRLVALIFAPKKIMSNQVKEMAVRLKPLLNEGDVGCKWESSLDKIFSPGNYVVEIDHTGSNVGLPVKFCGAEHYIVGNLVVTDSGTAGPKQHERVIGQSLTFTARDSKATKVYTRTYANGRWGEWHSLIEAGKFDKITTTDELISTVAAISNDIDTLKGAGDGSIAAVISAAMEKGRVLAKRDLFIAAGALYNDTDAAIERTSPWGESVQHLAGRYYLNGLGDITEEQMLAIYNRGYFNDNDISPFGYSGSGSASNIRTNLVRCGMWNGSLAGYLCISNYTIEVLNLHIMPMGTSPDTCNIKLTNAESVFSTAPKLRVIDTRCLISAAWKPSSFTGCVNLTEIRITVLGSSLDLKSCSKISKASVLCMIQNAVPKNAITITLHADAYARLESDADIVAALEAQPLVSLVSA